MHWRRWLVVVLLLIVVIGWLGFGDKLSLDPIFEREDALRSYVQQHPIWSPISGFAIYLALSLVPGTPGKSIVYGWLFGFWIGLVISSTALTIAAVINFLIVRYLLRSVVEAKLSKIIEAIDRAISRNGGSYLLSLRLVHAPYSLVNYASGATAVPVTTFAWTTWVGMLPGTIVFVLAGSQLPTLRTMAQQGVWSIVDLKLLGLLSLFALLPIGTRWALRRFPHGHQELDEDSLSQRL
ncbi:TVP38/TMEM64 family protein [Novipirellula caenicola]|uniref:TVP38/TMEM64 family membrane protein n=1 Tax=Novipirellula caenicola TaxID=1536901 RepID=A0ABP9VHL6_9BACT